MRVFPLLKKTNEKFCFDSLATVIIKRKQNSDKTFQILYVRKYQPIIDLNHFRFKNEELNNVSKLCFGVWEKHLR